MTKLKEKITLDAEIVPRWKTTCAIETIKLKKKIM